MQSKLRDQASKIYVLDYDFCRWTQRYRVGKIRESCDGVLEHAIAASLTSICPTFTCVTDWEAIMPESIHVSMSESSIPSSEL